MKEECMKVCINSQWDRLCSSLWDGNDATIVCSQAAWLFTTWKVKVKVDHR